MGIKYAVNENFFKKWSPEMTYILGYFYADGSMEDASYLRGKYIRVSSIDKSTILKIRNWLKSKHTIVKINPPTNNGHKRYLLRIGNHTLYNDLIKLGLYPNKSLTVKFPNIPQKYFNHFVRGYFDGDGCVRICMRKGKRQKLVISKLSTVFTCGSKEFLEKLAKQLNENIKTKNIKVYNGCKSYMLCYSTEDSVKLFKFLYRNLNKNDFLERKFDRFRDYFNKRPQRIDSKVNNILRYLGNGQVVK
ncbi:MAG: LAGLIDADG family homing endonuclease [Parcubacteria group bacterium]